MKYKIKNESKEDEKKFVISFKLDNDNNYFNLYADDKKGGKFLFLQFDRNGQMRLDCVNACVHAEIDENNNIKLITVQS